MRARTLKMISDLTGRPIEATTENRRDALRAAQAMLTDPKHSPALNTYDNGTLAYLAGMVAQHDTLVVQELAELKIYVVNKLVAETDNEDPKIRLTALRALGEVDGVDAFKRRSEVTIKQKPMEEVEQEMLDILARIEQRNPRVVQDVDVKSRAANA